MLTATEQRKIMMLVRSMAKEAARTQKMRDVAAIPLNKMTPAYVHTRKRLVELLKEVG